MLNINSQRACRDQMQRLGALSRLNHPHVVIKKHDSTLSRTVCFYEKSVTERSRSNTIIVKATYTCTLVTIIQSMRFCFASS